MVRYSIIITRTIQAIVASEGSDMVSKFYSAYRPFEAKGDHCGIDMPDLIPTSLYHEIMIPEGITTISNVYAIVIPLGTGDLDWEVTTDWFGLDASEQYNAGSDTASGTTSITNGDGEKIDITAAFTGATENDVVGVVFKRDGGDVADTVGATVLYVGLYVSGV